MLKKKKFFLIKFLFLFINIRRLKKRKFIFSKKKKKLITENTPFSNCQIQFLCKTYDINESRTKQKINI